MFERSKEGEGPCQQNTQKFSGACVPLDSARKVNTKPGECFQQLLPPQAPFLTFTEWSFDIQNLHKTRFHSWTPGTQTNESAAFTNVGEASA